MRARRNPPPEPGVVHEIEGLTKKRIQAGLYFIFFSLLGLLFLAFTADAGKNLVLYPTLDARTMGVVTEENRAGRGCSSTVEYVVEGKSYTASLSSCPGLIALVPVRYDSARPERSNTHSPGRAYIGYPITMAITSIIALMFFGLAYLCGRLARGRLERLPMGLRQDALRRLGIDHKKPRVY